VVRIYPLLGNGCVFYGPSLDYISGTEPNEIRERERENENGASPRHSRKKGSAEYLLRFIVIDRD
jgi:hypothetical protein